MPRRALILLAGTVALLLVVGRIASGVLVEQAWFEAMQGRGVWMDALVARVLVASGAWLVASVIAFANLWAVRLTILTVAVPARVANLDIAAMIPARRLFWATAAISGIVGLIPLIAIPSWTVAAPTWLAAPFREYEGFFQHDVAFYVYWLPFERAVHEYLLVSLAVAAAVTITLYAITRSLNYERGRFAASSHVRHHMAVLATAALLLVAWGFRLDAFSTLLDGSGTNGMFTPQDHLYHSRSLLWLAVVTLVVALVVLRTAWMGQVRATFVALSALLVTGVALREIAPRIRFPEAESRDNASYEETRALFSRRAFDVPAVIGVAGADSVRLDTLGSRSSDRRVAFEQLLSRHAWWESDLLARLATRNDPSRSLVVAPAWQQSDNGEWWATALVRTDVRDADWELVRVAGNRWEWDGLATVARAPLTERAVPTPLIGPDVSGHVLRQGSNRPDETRRGWGAFIDAPAATVSLTSWWRRLAFVWITRDASIWQASDSTARILLHRDMRTIVSRMAPWHRVGRDITPVVMEDRVLWAAPLYMTSNSYPLSAPVLVLGTEHRMFRRVATMLVDGMTGQVRVVPMSAVDPLTAHWLSRMEALVLTADDVPKYVRAQFPFGLDGATAQLRTIAQVNLPRQHTAHPLMLPDSFPVTLPVPPMRMLSASATQPLQGGRAESPAPDVAVSAWTVPLLAPDQTVAGSLTIQPREAGPARLTWYAHADSLRPYAERRRALSAALDSATDALRLPEDTDLVDGTVRPLPNRSGTVPVLRLTRARFAVQREGARLLAIAVEGEDGVVVVTVEKLFDLAGRGAPVMPGSLPAGTSAARPATGPELRRLYNAVLEAMRAGSWVRLGVALDSLGQAVRRAP